MVNIGIIGSINTGKTSCFSLFIKYLEESGERILQGAPGGPEKTYTETVDFIRFSYRGFLHVLYGTGGHKNQITEYYRRFVLRNADEFLVMIDLSEDLGHQFRFLHQLRIPANSVVLSLNKYDLDPERLKPYSQKVTEYFKKTLNIQIKDIYPTVAIEYNDEYEDYNKNCIRAILSLCSKEKEDPFAVWDT